MEWQQLIYFKCVAETGSIGKASELLHVTQPAISMSIKKMEEDIPVGRLAQPIEIAKAVFWLGSEENTYITGQQIVVDGGLTIK